MKYYYVTGNGPSNTQHRVAIIKKYGRRVIDADSDGPFEWSMDLLFTEDAPSIEELKAYLKKFDNPYGKVGYIYDWTKHIEKRRRQVKLW